MPSAGSSITARVLSRIRITHFSPKAVGMVDTRTSSSRPPIVTAICPSCGRRRSTMFMSDMTLIRLMSAGPIGPGRVVIWCSAPSVRTRTRTGRSHGLDVHVGGAVVHRLLENDVDDLDDRCVLVDDGLHDRVGRL